MDLAFEGFVGGRVGCYCWGSGGAGVGFDLWSGVKKGGFVRVGWCQSLIGGFLGWGSVSGGGGVCFKGMVVGYGFFFLFGGGLFIAREGDVG